MDIDNRTSKHLDAMYVDLMYRLDKLREDSAKVHSTYIRENYKLTNYTKDKVTAREWRIICNCVDWRIPIYTIVDYFQEYALALQEAIGNLGIPVTYNKELVSYTINEECNNIGKLESVWGLIVPTPTALDSNATIVILPSSHTTLYSAVRHPIIEYRNLQGNSQALIQALTDAMGEVHVAHQCYRCTHHREPRRCTLNLPRVVRCPSMDMRWDSVREHWDTVKEHCGGCHYASKDMRFCGLGREMVPACNHKRINSGART
ncbi:hypothetical protein [Microcoleus phage My-WqHQDG]|nr:hypothetical protein [Microcoleus phage My-WqHQDG]